MSQVNEGGSFEADGISAPVVPFLSNGGGSCYSSLAGLSVPQVVAAEIPIRQGGEPLPISSGQVQWVTLSEAGSGYLKPFFLKGCSSHCLLFLTFFSSQNPWQTGPHPSSSTEKTLSDSLLSKPRDFFLLPSAPLTSLQHLTLGTPPSVLSLSPSFCSALLPSAASCSTPTSLSSALELPS